jgi:hypothetical protein
MRIGLPGSRKPIEAALSRDVVSRKETNGGADTRTLAAARACPCNRDV